MRLYAVAREDGLLFAGYGYKGPRWRPTGHPLVCLGPKAEMEEVGIELEWLQYGDQLGLECHLVLVG